jgi:ubiquinone/menaquinone biosynthesis C-methylase UbiE
MSQLDRQLEPEVMDSPLEAVEYDQMDHQEPNQALVKRLVELAAHGHMLDIGTGPGHIPLLVCQQIDDASVFGVDLSKEMLKLARAHLEASDFADRIEFHFMDAKELGFADDSFDVVFSNSILHHIPDPKPFIAQAWRVLKPGGVLLIRDLFRPADQMTLKRLVQQYACDTSDDQKRLFSDSLHAALTPDELRELVDQLGLQEVEVVIDTDRHMSLQTRSAKK